MSTDRFLSDIDKFNQIYKLPRPNGPTLLGAERIKNFRNILTEEVTEGDDLVERYEAALAKGKGELAPEDRLALMTELSDWLGDIVVYCASEARRWGLPMGDILNVIMESNFSKLDGDGQPIYDDRGKVMKGPNYWKPEPKIQEMLVDQTSGHIPNEAQ